jgi:hypothetical protein
MSTVDYWGIPISIGDEVAFILTNYRQMVTGRIISISAKTALIEYIHPTYKSVDEAMRDPANIIKKPTPTTKALE